MDVEEVISKYFSETKDISIKRINNGSINTTYYLKIIKDSSIEEYILQEMKDMFDVSMMEDIEAVTNHLSSKGILTQKVIKSKEGGLFVRDSKSWWRMLSYIKGQTFSEITTINQAKEAGKLIGTFHNALSDFNYNFKFKLENFHNTLFFMNKLEKVLEKNIDTDKYKELKTLADSILNSYKNLNVIPNLPNHIIHADLKISNIVFDDTKEKAIALIDWDTLMYSTIAVELGDALRSWCLIGGEDVSEAHFNNDFYVNALDGYISTAKFLTSQEKDSIPYGVKLMALELSARFTIDAFEECYFNLDSSKYTNLFEQQKKRAQNQYDFYKEFATIY